MQGKRVLTAATCVAALAIGSGAASAATMHPTLGAKLAGMGEHGVVNLQSNSAQGPALLDVRRDDATGSRARRSATRSGMVVAKLGPAYKAKSCAMVSKKALAMIESKPGAYRVWVDTKAHTGELRGTLFRGHGAHVRNVGRSTAMDETHADPQPPRKVGRAVFLGAVAGGVSSLYWGKAVWGQVSAQRLARRGAHPADPDRAAGGSTRSPARMPTFDPQTWQLDARRPRRASRTSISYDAAAGAAEGRAGLDVPLRHRLDGARTSAGAACGSTTCSRSRARSRRAHALEFVSAEMPYVDSSRPSRPACTT